MELYKALKTVIDLQGSEILKDPRLVNILSDFKAYDEIPAAKFIIKSMINENLISKLLAEYSSSQDISTLMTTNRKNLTDFYGFKEDTADYILQCIFYALNWIEEIPTLNIVSNDESFENEQHKELVSVVDDGKHLLFKQFPINGNANDFIQLLSTAGYTIDLPYNSTYNYGSLRGSFAGENDCTIAVVGTPKSHIVASVMVFFQPHQIWYSIKEKYEKIKNLLTKKYGRPESHEFFSDPYYEGDGYELQALSNEHCTWMSLFKLPNGTVSVSMSSESKILIIYQDKINQDIRETEQNSIANDDL